MGDKTVNSDATVSKLSELGLMGVTEQELKTLRGTALAEAKEKLGKDASMDALLEYADKIVVNYINNTLLKQVVVKSLGDAKADALSQQTSKIPGLQEKLTQDVLLARLTSGTQIDQDTFSDWQKRFAKHQDTIISAAIDAKISPYQAMAGLASLGVFVGGIATMVGQASGKPEWSEWGAKTMAFSVALGDKAGEAILDLDRKQKMAETVRRAPDGWSVTMDYYAQARIARQGMFELMNDSTANRAIMEGGDRMYQSATDRLGAGRPVNNPGNLRDKTTGQFRQFQTVADGVKAMKEDLMAKVTGQSPAMKAAYGANYTPTLEKLISVYAPPKENNTKAYIETVSKATGIKPDQTLTAADVDKLILPMTKVEGTVPVETVAAVLGTKVAAKVDQKATAPTPDAKKGQKTATKVSANATDLAEKHAMAEQPKDELRPVFVAVAAANADAYAGTSGRSVGHEAGVAVVALNEENKPGKVENKTPAANAPLARLDLNMG